MSSDRSRDCYHSCHLSLQFIIPGFCAAGSWSIQNAVFVLLSDSLILILQYQLYQEIISERTIFSVSQRQSQQNYPLKILNISTIIGFQLLAEIFMASNIKMKSLSGFNIIKLWTEEIPWQAINLEIDHQLAVVFSFENSQ